MISIVIAFAGIIQLPQTGQTTSYAAGDDGALQGGVASPSPRFADNVSARTIMVINGKLSWWKEIKLDMAIQY